MKKTLKFIPYIMFWTGMCALGVSAFLVATGSYLGGAVWCLVAYVFLKNSL